MPRKEPLARRKISDSLKKQRGWRCISHVDGTVDVFLPRGTESVDRFLEAVGEAVRALGFTPRLRVHRTDGGETCVRLDTPETLAQEGRGAHGFRL
jgi:hypothetical protein